MPSQLNEILTTLNNQAERYQFGRLQIIRKNRRPLRRLSNRYPFRVTDTDREWAHHHGGQMELQFNVSNEEGLLRWGIALSLQRCRQVPDVTILHPRLKRLSQFLEKNGENLSRIGFRMWDWTGPSEDRQRSEDRQPQCIDDHLYNPGSFVFVGKRAPFDCFDPNLILRDFDLLLPVYEFVEFEEESALTARDTLRRFEFQPDQSATGERLLSTTAMRYAEVYVMSLRHGVIQDTLKRELEQKGATVHTEHPDGRGGSIDLVAERDDELEFYEIKTDFSSRLAIRNAIGQLLEYAYWPEPARPERLFVVSECALDTQAESYLRILKEEFGLSIGYRQVMTSRGAHEES